MHLYHYKVIFVNRNLDAADVGWDPDLPSVVFQMIHRLQMIRQKDANWEISRSLQERQ